MVRGAENPHNEEVFSKEESLLKSEYGSQNDRTGTKLA